MRNIFIIFKKELKDTLKNKLILLQFILFPLMAIIMENTIHIEGMPPLFFTNLFSIMYIGMSPVVATAAIISEEKEKNTLRVLLMANVKSYEYLLGIGVYVFFICMLGAFSMSFSYLGIDKLFYLSIMGIGFIISIILGACVGMYSKNQMTATSIVTPLMLLFAFGPMIAIFNDNIKMVAKVFYTEQLMESMNARSFNLPLEAYITLGVTIVLFAASFGIIYKKKGLE